MKLETFFENFAALADAPNGVQKLRELILQLAVQGKLVPQDPHDEPASELLRRIAAEKITAKNRNRCFAEVEEDEQSFSAPRGWQWIRVGKVFSIRTGFAFKSSTYTDDGILVFRVTNFNRDGSFDLSDLKLFPTENIDDKISKYLLQEGEIVMVMVGGTIGKTTIITDEILPALLNQNMWRMRSFGHQMCNDFEYLLVKSINQKIENLTNSTHGHFAMSDYEQKPVCIPPLEEQRRIVAKVDQLMALCDELEARQQKARESGLYLNNAALNRLLSSPDAEAFEANWRRVCEHFDLLYDNPENVNALRQAILQLAVMGKLVPQDPNDEPAEILLERIWQEKERLVMDGEIRKPPRIQGSDDFDALFELPSNWKWARTQDVFNVITDGDHQPPPKTSSGIPFLVIGNVRNGWIDFAATRFVPEDYYGSIDTTRRPKKGDILYTVVGSYGIPIIVNTEAPFVCRGI